MKKVTKRGLESCAVRWLCSWCPDGCIHLCDDWWTRTRTETAGLTDPGLGCTSSVKTFQSLPPSKWLLECSSGAWQWIFLFFKANSTVPPHPHPQPRVVNLYNYFGLLVSSLITLIRKDIGAWSGLNVGLAFLPRTRAPQRSSSHQEKPSLPVVGAPTGKLLPAHLLRGIWTFFFLL